MVEGVNMTLKEILKVFEQFSVKPFESLEKPLTRVYIRRSCRKKQISYPENTVSTELQKGYMIHDRLLRPAMVVVSKKPENQKNKDQIE